ncbi:4Fe-4S binding protein [Thermodesulfobacteriota bacterium]
MKKKPPSSGQDLANIETAAQNPSKDSRFIPFVGILPSSPPEGKEEIEIETGAIVIATGFSSYVPGKGEYGYIRYPEVITLRDLIRIFSETESKGNYLEIDGREIKSIAMIHCVGSRQIAGIHEPDENGNINENCSRTCCTGLLYSGLNIKNRFPDTAIFNIYRDIRTYGREQEELYAEASSKDVRFIRYSVENPPVVRKCDDKDYSLSVFVADTMLENEELEVPADLVVLATGMCPGKIDSLIELLKIACGADGFLLEVHPKLRPVEVFTAGIYLAGSCQAPMDITEAAAAASAAAVKASILLSKGEVSLEPFVAKVDKDECARCLSCVRACPFDIPILEDDGAYVNPAACYGCGACVSACPGEAISLAHYDNRELKDQVKGALDPGMVNAQNTEVTTGG